MKRFSQILLMLLLAVMAGCSAATPALTQAAPVNTQAAQGNVWPTQGWKTSTPAEQGIDPAGLAKAIENAHQKNLNLDSLLVIRSGAIVSETYFRSSTAETRHELYSCTKSFTSTLVGIAIDQGRLDGVHHKVSEYFPKLLAENNDPRKAILTLENLLTMTSGLDWSEGDPIYEAMYRSGDWVKFVLDTPMRSQPGSEFNYCSGCSHLLSAIVQQAAGVGTQAFADQVLFKPLGITNYRWDTDSNGIPIGGWGLQLTPRDMAKLGYLFLHNGSWDGQQIVSEAWVKSATQKQMDTGGTLGYGYQWWIEPAQAGYSARGRYGQTIFVVPPLDLIVVTTAMSNNEDEIYRLINNEIIPVVKPR